VAAARWSDAAAPPGGGVGAAALRASEVVRDAARRRALATLAPERAGLLVGMALGDTSLLPGDLERDFRAAGLTHLSGPPG
jgi:competence protein ComEC